MEQSRDDFVIAIRSAFLKKGTKQRFSLLGLLFFSILLIVLSKFNFTAINYLKLGINEVVFRTSFIASLPEKYIGYSFRAIKEHIVVYKDYNLKKEELEKLKYEKHNVNFLKAENKRLKKVLEDISSSSEEVIAKVIIDKQSPYLRSIILNKGTRHNIKKGIPPTIFICGTKDNLIPVATGELFKKKIEKVGGRCDLHWYQDQKHGFFNAMYTETMLEVDKFLVSLGYLKGSATLK